MSSNRHSGTAIAWGKVIAAKDSSRNAIVRLPGWTGPAVLPEAGKFKPLPGVPSTLSALDLVQSEQAVHCTFPGCGPFVTIAQGTRRAAFRHPSGKNLSGHDSDPETLDHSESKTILLEWVLRTCEVTHFDLDGTNLRLPASPVTGDPDESLQRRPDAYVELADGGKIAIEYQYSAGSGQLIREKTRLYAQEGITVWWIFSGRSPHTLRLHPSGTLRNGKRRHAVTDLTTTQQEMLHADIPFFWFDREHRVIATPARRTARPITPREYELWLGENLSRNRNRPQTSRKYWGPLIKGFSEYAFLLPSPLTDCRINTRSGELTTGGMSRWTRDDDAAAAETERLRGEARIRFTRAQQQREDAERASRDAQAQASGPVVSEERPEPGGTRNGPNEANTPRTRKTPPTITVDPPSEVSDGTPREEADPGPSGTAIGKAVQRPSEHSSAPRDASTTSTSRARERRGLRGFVHRLLDALR